MRVYSGLENYLAYNRETTRPRPKQFETDAKLRLSDTIQPDITVDEQQLTDSQIQRFR